MFLPTLLLLFRVLSPSPSPLPRAPHPKLNRTAFHRNPHHPMRSPPDPCTPPHAVTPRSPPPHPTQELLGNVPYPSLWLRYSSFIPLYPLGVASELTMVYLAMPTIRDSGMWSIRMPNAYNWGFDYYWACILAVLTYLPGLPQLYLYMLTQRRKQLGGGSKGKAKQA